MHWLLILHICWILWVNLHVLGWLRSSRSLLSLCNWQMISSLCNKEFVVHSCFVEKMGNFHYNPVEGMDNLANLLNWSKYLEDSKSENMRGFACCFGGGGGLICFWWIYIFIVVFCKTVY